MVKDFGYKTDSDGKPIQYVTGQLLDPIENNGNNNPNYVRIYFKTAESTARETSSVKSGNDRSGSYE